MHRPAATRWLVPVKVVIPELHAGHQGGVKLKQESCRIWFSCSTREAADRYQQSMWSVALAVADIKFRCGRSFMRNNAFCTEFWRSSYPLEDIQDRCFLEMFMDRICRHSQVVVCLQFSGLGFFHLSADDMIFCQLHQGWPDETLLSLRPWFSKGPQTVVDPSIVV